MGEEESTSWINLFDDYSTPWCGYVDGEKKMNTLIERFKDDQNIKYYLAKKKGVSAQHKVRFEDASRYGQHENAHRILADKVPFIIQGLQILHCHRGGSSKKNVDCNYQDKKRRRRRQGTKKLDCQARIIIREILRFPDFKMEKDSVKRRMITSKRLRDALNDTPDLVKSEQRFYISLPRLSEHNHDKDVKKNVRFDINRNSSRGAPYLLKNKPHNFTVHCTERLETGELIENISCTDNMKFLVQSAESPEHAYEVKFACDGRTLSCECLDWKKNRWPCKHMFAVLRECKHEFEELKLMDINSVFNAVDETMTIVKDPDDVPISEPECDENDFEDGVCEDISESHDEETCEDTPELVNDKETALKCRMIFYELYNATYSIKKKELLLEMERRATDLFDWLLSKITLGDDSRKQIVKKRKARDEVNHNQLPKVKRNLQNHVSKM